MCLWFWKKKNELLPSDFNKGLMTANFSSFKVGTKLTIPNNCVCFLSYKDKVYLKLTEGTTILNQDSIPALHLKQAKRNNKIKKYAIDLFFINTSSFNFALEYLDKIPIQSQLTKVIFSYNFNLSIVDSNKFFDFVTGNVAFTNSNITEGLVLDIIEQFLRRYFLHKSLESINISLDMKEDINNRLEKHIEKIGLQLKNFTLTTYPVKGKSNQPILTTNPQSMFSSPKAEKTIDEKPNLSYDTNVQSIEKIAPQDSNQTNENNNLCPNCKSKIVNGAIFCHRCGYRF